MTRQSQTLQHNTQRSARRQEHSESGGEGQKGAGLREMTGQWVEKASDQARQQIMNRLSGQKDMVAERLVNLGGMVRRATDGIRDQAPELAVDYMSRAADRVERLSEYLMDADVERMLGDAEVFIRRNPGPVLAGSIALGFIAGRFLKSSPSASETSSV